MGLREISPAGKHSQLSNRKIVSMLPEWTNPKLFLQPYGHLGLAFPTPDHCEAKASKQPKSFMSAIVQFSHVGLATFVLCLDQGSQFKFI